MIPINPPAFPSETAPSRSGAWGMTLRDYFAAAAIPAAAANLRKNLEIDSIVLAFCDDHQMDMLADDCYALADALLEARASKKTSMGDSVRRINPTRTESCLDTEEP